MENIQAKYYKFKRRLFINSGLFIGLLMIVFFDFIILRQIGLINKTFLIFNIFFLFLISLIFYSCLIKSRYYIDKIVFLDNSIVLGGFRYDTKLNDIEIQFCDLKVDIYQNLFEIYSEYRLEIKRKSIANKSGYDLIIKQYEIGFWKRDRLKQIYKFIRDNQGKFAGTDFVR